MNKLILLLLPLLINAYQIKPLGFVPVDVTIIEHNKVVKTGVRLLEVKDIILDGKKYRGVYIKNGVSFFYVCFEDGMEYPVIISQTNDDMLFVNIPKRYYVKGSKLVIVDNDIKIEMELL